MQCFTDEQGVFPGDATGVLGLPADRQPARVLSRLATALRRSLRQPKRRLEDSLAESLLRRAMGSLSRCVTGLVGRRASGHARASTGIRGIELRQILPYKFETDCSLSSTISFVVPLSKPLRVAAQRTLHSLLKHIRFLSLLTTLDMFASIIALAVLASPALASLSVRVVVVATAGLRR